MSDSAGQQTWIDRIDALARAHPDALALIVTGEAGESLSWRDLAWRSAGAARLFAAHGVAAGDVVCVQLPNCAAIALAALAAWQLGATVLPLRSDLPLAESAQLLTLARPALIVRDAAGEGVMAAAELVAAAPADPATLPPAPVTKPAWMIASSGSTGNPKLIAPATHTGLRDAAAGGCRAPNGRHRTHIVCSPLYHTQGFALLFMKLVEDVRVLLMPRFEVETFLDLVEREHVASFALVPTMAIRLLASPTIRGRDFASVESATVGAGATPDWAIRELIALIGGEKIVVGYGMSEGLATALIRGDEWLKRPGSVGRPTGADTLVADEEGRSLPAGEIGELFFRPQRGTHGFRYVGTGEARTLPGGWVSVGDIGRVDEDGYLYIVDRRTDMIKTGGANVYVSEVEAALLAHPAVADVAVIGLADPEWGRRVHAIVQLHEGAGIDGIEDALRDHGRTLLARYKVPRSFEFVATLGRSDMGKLSRQALVRARDAANG